MRPVTFTLVSANLINWGGNWALIYGHLGLPAMGLKGSGCLDLPLAHLHGGGTGFLCMAA